METRPPQPATVATAPAGFVRWKPIRLEPQRENRETRMRLCPKCGKTGSSWDGGFQDPMIEPILSVASETYRAIATDFTYFGRTWKTRRSWSGRVSRSGERVLLAQPREMPKRSWGHVPWDRWSCCLLAGAGERVLEVDGYPILMHPSRYHTGTCSHCDLGFWHSSAEPNIEWHEAVAGNQLRLL